MTTIKLKNGSGAPTAGDLAQGEPALDLTNKRLYTEDSGGTVIEVGTNPGVDVTFADNRKAVFGDGSDLQIYHDGSNSYIQDQGLSGTGNLILAGADVEIATFGGNKYFSGSSNIARLYHTNNEKLATTSTGIDVTGNATFDDNGKAIFGAGSDLQIYHDGANSYVQDAGDGALILNTTNGGGVYVYSAGETMATFNSNGAVNLYYDNAAKLATTATGIDVTGTVTADGLTASGSGAVGSFDRTDANAIIELKRSGSLQGYIGASTGGDIILYNASASQKLRAADNGDISFYEDTGTTAKFFWDASEETLALGVSAANARLEVGAFATTSSDIAYFSNSNGSHKGIIRLDAQGDGEFVLRDAGNNEDVVITAGGDSYFNGGNVGIGTNSPSQLLHLTNSGFAYARLNNSSFTGIDIGQHTGGNVYFNLRDNKDQIFQTNNTEAMRIDSSGNLLVGKTSAALAGAGTAILASGTHNVTVDGDTTLQLNRLNSDGAIATFFKDGLTAGIIGTLSGNASFGSGDVHLNFNATSNLIEPMSTVSGGASNGAIDLGGSLRRFKDLYLSGGAYLGGTGSANKLDDYETGTFTPTITFGGASTGVAYTSRSGRYIKIGKLVYINIALNLSNKGSSTGDAKVTGLPFTQSSEGVNFPNLNLRSVAGITFTNCLYATANDGTTEIQLMDDNGSGTQTNLTNSDFTTTAEFNITGVYEAA